MAIYKNKSGQKIPVFAVDASGIPKTGDAANITAQISKDGGASTALTDTNPTELDATNHKGVYVFDLSQSESNADLIILSSASSTSGVVIRPLLIYTEPQIRDAQVVGQDNIDFSATQKTSLNSATPAVTVSDKTGFELSATGADLILKTSAFAQAIAAAINELATYGLTALNTLLVSTGIKATSIPNATLANGAHGGAGTTITLQTPIVASVSSVPDSAGVTTILGQLTGITSLASWLRGLFRKSAMDATAKSEVNTGGGTYDEATDSIEAIRDTAPLGTAMRGTDSAALASTALSNEVWTDAKAAFIDAKISEAGGGETLDAAQIRAAIGMSLANLDSQLSTIVGYIDTELTSIISELAKVPKSDSNVSWNATALAAVRTKLEETGSHLALIKAKTDLALLNTTWTDTKAGYLDVPVSVAGSGSGGILWSYSVTNSVDDTPIADVDIRVSTDSAGLNIIASGRTNVSGVVTFYLTAGTYYIFRQKAGWNFTNPDTEVVS
jgi:hypothetical protein